MKLPNYSLFGDLLLNATRFIPRRVLRFSLALVFIAVLLPVSLFAQSNEVVTNKTVIQLNKAGLGKAIITSKINSSVCNFDLSTDGLIALKKSGVPDDIVAVMIAKGTPPPPPQDSGNNANNAPAPQNNQDQNSQSSGGEASLQPGLYYFNPNTNDYSEIDEAVFSNNKSGGAGEAALRSVSVLFNAKLKESLSNVEANLKIKSTKPLFVFVIDLSGNQNQLGPAVKSPNEVMLVKLKVGKNDRELVVGKSNAIGADLGIDDKVKIPFTYNKVQRGLYEVTPNAALPAGEYCFMYGVPGSGDQPATYKVYDFSIRAN